jgi:hypothetical protein
MQFALLILLGVPGALAQTAQPAGSGATQPSLDEILRHLQENLWDYQANIPDFFADEHVVSILKQEGARDMKTTTDSTFRLARSHGIGEARTFKESREIRLINKKPAKGDEIHGPAIFTGAFSNGLGVVSLEGSNCYDYTLEPAGELNKAPAILIGYALKPDVLNDPSCQGPERQSGRAWFDPVNFHTLRIEMTIPNHKDNNGVRVLWTWVVDYAPVSFDNKQFWLPKTIASKAEAYNASGIWSFVASYSNYHKLTVSSRILPDTAQ